jgi:CheY-like chemotaxis protein
VLQRRTFGMSGTTARELNAVYPVSQPGSLLVVDDEPEIVDVLVDFFVGQGYSVNCALNGRDALVLASLSRPDVVILDVQMPGPSGADVLRNVLALDDSIAVVMLSGADEEPLARQLLQAGAFDYVRKPLLFETLQHVVELAVPLGKRKTLLDDGTPWQCEPRTRAAGDPPADPDGPCGGCGERVGDGDTSAVRERNGLYHAACWLRRLTQRLTRAAS